MRTAVIVGSTGLVGSYLVRYLLASPIYRQVFALTRQGLQIHDPKLVQIKVDWSKLAEALTAVQAEDVFCCLGTTIDKAGSKKNFYQVDFQYPLDLARVMKARGALRYFLISALGADPRARVFYNRVKGEVEGAITGVGFQAVHIFRPSLLLGPRNERRRAEDIAKFFTTRLGFLIPAGFKAVHASQVAAAMVYYASAGLSGVSIHSSAEIRKFGALSN